MGDVNKTRRQYLTIKAADSDGRAIDVLISHDRLLAVARRGVGHITIGNFHDGHVKLGIL